MLKFYCTILFFYLWELAYYPKNISKDLKALDKNLQLIVKYFLLTLLTIVIGFIISVILLHADHTANNVKIFSWILVDFCPQILAGKAIVCLHNYSIRNCLFRVFLYYFFGYLSYQIFYSLNVKDGVDVYGFQEMIRPMPGLHDKHGDSTIGSTLDDALWLHTGPPPTIAVPDDTISRISDSYGLSPSEEDLPRLNPISFPHLTPLPKTNVTNAKQNDSSSLSRQKRVAGDVMHIIDLTELASSDMLLELYLLTKQLSILNFYLPAILSFSTLLSGKNFKLLLAHQEKNDFRPTNVAIKFLAAIHFWVLILQYVLNDNDKSLLMDGVNYFKG